MRKIISSLVILVSILGIGSQVLGQEGMSEADKNMVAFMTPGQPHKDMEKLVGDWVVDYTMWMEPGQEPMKMKGSCTNSMIFDGRYLKSDNNAIVMGQPMKGFMLQGFDNHRKVFNAIWIDSMGTGFAISEGKYDKDGALVMQGEMTDPMSGNLVQYRTVTTIIDKDKHTMDMYMVSPEGEFKSMALVFTRKE